MLTRLARASVVASSGGRGVGGVDRKSTRLNSSHSQISYAVFCLKKKKRTVKTIKSHYCCPFKLIPHRDCRGIPERNMNGILQVVYESLAALDTPRRHALSRLMCD